MDYAKTLKLRFRAGDLDLPERRKRHTRSQEEEGAHMCPCSEPIKSRIHIVGYCEKRKEERDVLEMRKLDECGMVKLGTLDSSEKTIAILVDRWWSQTAKQERDATSKKKVIFGKT